MGTKFSIITVCYNSEKTIERTLQSVLQQTYEDYEYIIIDGQSTDKTLEIVDRYKPLFGDKMKLVSEKDNGIYDAMNKGIRLAGGDLVGIVNSDDYYESDALENIAQAYNGEKYAIVYGLLRKVQQGREVMVYANNPDFLERDMIAHPSCFVTRKIYEELGVYSLKYKYSADYEFMLRIKKTGKIQFIEIYKIISNFSIDGASSSCKAYRDTLRLQKEYGLIDRKDYNWKMLKSGIALALGR